MRRYVVTDVTKDGTLQGPNLELLRQVMERTHRPVIASGGVSSLDDIAALRELVPHGLEGAIVGKALYAGAFTLAEALDVARTNDGRGIERSDSPGVPWEGAVRAESRTG